MKIHPYTDKFPLLTGAKFETLVTDIRDNGLINKMKVRLVNGEPELIDGRNRERALKQNGISILDDRGMPSPVYFSTIQLADSDVVPFVNSQNIHRRHMTDEEIGVLIANGMSIQEIAEATGKSEKTIYVKTEAVRTGQKEERNEKIKKMAAEGKTQREIANKLGVTQPTVSGVIKNSQIEKKLSKKKEPKPKPPKKEKVYEKLARENELPEGSIGPRKATDDMKQMTIWISDDVRTMLDDVAAKQGKSVIQIVADSVAAIATQRDLLSRPLSATAQEKLDIHKRKLDKEFEQAVHNRAHEMFWKKYDAELKRYADRLKEFERKLETRHGIMTAVEFKTLMQCVHPDTGQNVSEDKRNEAVRILNEKKLRLLPEKEDPMLQRHGLPRPPPLPETQADLLRMKAEQAAKRKRTKGAEQ